MENQDQEVFEFEESKPIESIIKKKMDLGTDDINVMVLQNALSLPLDKIDFTAMSIENIIHILNNSKTLELLSNNSSKDYIYDLAIKNEDVAIIFINEGIFIPFANQPLHKLSNGLTILDYVLMRNDKGEEIDLSIEFFDQKLIQAIVYYSDDLIDYTRIYCEHRRFLPFNNLASSFLICQYGNYKYSILDYILSIEPKFEVSDFQNTDAYAKLSVIRSYIKVGNLEFVLKNILQLSPFQFFYELPTDHTKKIIDIIIENNVILNEQLIDVLKIEISKLSERELLSKDRNGVTLLERVLQFNENLGEKLALNSLNNKKLQLQTSVILAKYGWYSKIDCKDEYTEEFQQYINSLILNFNNRYSILIHNNLGEEVHNLIQEFLKLFEVDSNKDLINMVLNVFYKQFSINKDNAIGYLNTIVNIKKRHPNFTLQYNISQGSGYEYDTKTVTVNSYDYSILSHEIGHAVHHFNGYEQYPEHIREMIEKLKADPSTIERLQSFASYFEEIIEKRRDELSSQFLEHIKTKFPGGFFAYYQKIKEEYAESVGNTEKLFAQAITRKSVNYQSEDDIFNKLLKEIPISFDDYFDMTFVNDQNEYISRFIKADFDSILMIENLMDAIFAGKWLDGKLEGVNAKCYSGHNSEYYSSRSSIFREVFANFSGLIGTITTGHEYIENNLRFLLGDELYDALIEYYNQLNDEKDREK